MAMNCERERARERGGREGGSEGRRDGGSLCGRQREAEWRRENSVPQSWETEAAAAALLLLPYHSDLLLLLLVLLPLLLLRTSSESSRVKLAEQQIRSGGATELLLPRDSEGISRATELKEGRREGERDRCLSVGTTPSERCWMLDRGASSAAWRWTVTPPLPAGNQAGRSGRAAVSAGIHLSGGATGTLTSPTPPPPS